jgi:poly-beta-1,6-N-acetyl-D-glucosamine synthase
MSDITTAWLLLAIPGFCFGYPFVMAWYWMLGGILYHFARERGLPPLDRPPELKHWPPISLLVPCYNEADTAEETFAAAAAIDYPDFEIVAINDGSRDDTARILEEIAARTPRMRVIHMARNQGKATALNAGALLANHEILVCIDGDALIDPRCLRWIANAFQRTDLGALTGNPRIRNRSTLLGRLQVGEFSATIGLIKRAQATYGRLFTISGVMCAFRKRALEDAGWWSPRTLTDDIDVTWRVQLAGWRITYEPNAVCWILMPETLKGLWRQRLRWAEGGIQMMTDFFLPMLRGRNLKLVPVYLNFVVSVLWSYIMLGALGLGLIHAAKIDILPDWPAFGIVPEWWGAILAVTYLLQALVSHLLERRYEPDMLKSLYWIIWYPMAFWFISTATTVVALPRALLRPRKQHTTWVSPDRGLR